MQKDSAVIDEKNNNRGSFGSTTKINGKKIVYQDPLFGRLTKVGRDYLIRIGWKTE